MGIGPLYSRSYADHHIPLAMGHCILEVLLTIIFHLLWALGHYSRSSADHYIPLAMGIGPLYSRSYADYHIPLAMGIGPLYSRSSADHNIPLAMGIGQLYSRSSADHHIPLAMGIGPLYSRSYADHHIPLAMGIKQSHLWSIIPVQSVIDNFHLHFMKKNTDVVLAIKSDDVLVRFLHWATVVCFVVVFLNSNITII